MSRLLARVQTGNCRERQTEHDGRHMSFHSKLASVDDFRLNSTINANMEIRYCFCKAQPVDYQVLTLRWDDKH